jgi:2,4-diaminopentanoate dehydrogenase
VLGQIDRTHPSLAQQLDREARAAGVTLLGTGVNPGFVMDFLPAVLAGPCQRVSAIEVWRSQEAGTRRLPLQRKVGAGLSPDEFAAGVEAGRIGHVGLGQSARALGAALGWRLDDVAETIAPLITDGAREYEAGTIRAGMVAGVHQVAIGSVAGRKRIRLTLEMGVGVEDPRDEVVVHGDPVVHARFPGGISGDRATAALVVNALPHVLAAAPGLVSMADLPPPRFWGEPVG